MADIVKNERVLNMVFGFEDGDDRTISANNPNTALNLGACCASLGSYAREHSILLGDKNSADCTGVKSAKIVNQKTTYLDLNL